MKRIIKLVFIIIVSLFIFTSCGLSEEDKAYIEEVCAGVAQNVAQLDERIQANLKGWKMERIGKTDLAILRLAIYEMLYREDIPYKVSINEAVELAKVYCESSSPSFINGVLGAIVSSLPNKGTVTDKEES